MDERSNNMPSIRPASDLRTKYTQVLDEVHQTGRPMFLTKRNKCDTVIMSADTFAKYELTHEAIVDEYI